MREEYFEDLREMAERKAPTAEYLHKIIAASKDLQGNDFYLVVYAALEAVRDLGKEYGAEQVKKDIIRYLNH